MKLKIILMMITYSMLFGLADGQMESLQIDGPREAKPGTLVRLTAKTTAEETPFWIVLEPNDLDYEQVESGRRLMFSTGCRTGPTITVILLAQQVRDGRIVTRQLRRKILVKGGSDTQPLKPPRPHPVPPDGEPLTGSPLYSVMFQTWPQIKTDMAKSRTRLVAENMEKVAQACLSGEIKTKPEIWKTLASQNRIDLQVETPAWEPIATVLQRKFRELELPDVSSHGFHLRAVAAAFRAAYAASQSGPQDFTYPKVKR